MVAHALGSGTVSHAYTLSTSGNQMAFSAAAGFEQKYKYPEAACKEALLNAIAHRDYSIQMGLRFIFKTTA